MTLQILPFEFLLNDTTNSTLEVLVE